MVEVEVSRVHGRLSTSSINCNAHHLDCNKTVNLDDYPDILEHLGILIDTVFRHFKIIGQHDVMHCKYDSDLGYCTCMQLVHHRRRPVPQNSSCVCSQLSWRAGYIILCCECYILHHTHVIAVLILPGVGIYTHVCHHTIAATSMLD